MLPEEFLASAMYGASLQSLEATRGEPVDCGIEEIPLASGRRRDASSASPRRCTEPINNARWLPSAAPTRSRARGPSAWRMLEAGLKVDEGRRAMLEDLPAAAAAI